MLSLGVGYQLTPQTNLGAHYWHARQTGASNTAHGKVNMASMVLNHELSKRTNVYAEVDYMKLKGDGLSLTSSDGAVNGAKSRAGLTLGMQHRF